MSEEMAAPEDCDFETLVSDESADRCGGKIRISDRGNPEYAWLYLENTSDKTADLTIERRWIYNQQQQRDTKRHSLYPGELREVFSFPRNQTPQITIIACNLS